MENKDILELGSIVLLEQGTQKLMVIARGVYYKNDSGEDQLMDYMGCLYPEGIDPEQTIFFNHEDVDEVLFHGFVDEDEERFKVVYGEWLEDQK